MRLIRTLCATCLAFPIAGLAAIGATNITIGPAAQNAIEVVGGVTELISAVMYIASAIMFISAILKLRIHMQNPQQVPIGTPITEFVLAIILGVLPVATEMALRTFKPPAPSVLAPFMQNQRAPQG